MAPEIFKKSTSVAHSTGFSRLLVPSAGHGKPVDVWAMGVITYFLLCGYTPFDRDTQQQEMEAIVAGDYKFEPEEYWANVSSTARNFVTECLTIDPGSRPTAAQMLKHKWLSTDLPHFVPDPSSPSGGPTDLLPHVKKHFDAKKTCRLFPPILARRDLVLNLFFFDSPKSSFQYVGYEAYVYARFCDVSRRAQPRAGYQAIQRRIRKGLNPDTH